MKLTDKIHLLQIDFTIDFGKQEKLARYVNLLIIFGPAITLVDTGVKGSEDKLFAYIREQGRDPASIKTVILSHAHPDHIGSAARIKELTGCRIMAHPLDKEWIENIDLQYSQRPVPGFYNLVDQPVRVDDDLQDEQVIQADEQISIEILHAPGHSKGSVNLLFREDRLLFTADSIPLKNDIPNYDCYPDLMQSLNRIIEKRRYNTLLTSWTPPIQDMFEAYCMMDEGEEFLIRIDKVVKEVYVGEEPQPLYFCSKAISRLELPGFMINPVVDRAFRSHLIPPEIRRDAIPPKLL